MLTCIRSTGTNARPVSSCRCSSTSSTRSRLPTKSASSHPLETERCALRDPPLTPSHPSPTSHSPFTGAIYAKRDAELAKGKGKESSPEKAVTGSAGRSSAVSRSGGAAASRREL